MPALNAAGAVLDATLRALDLAQIGADDDDQLMHDAGVALPNYAALVQLRQYAPKFRPQPCTMSVTVRGGRSAYTGGTGSSALCAHLGIPPSLGVSGRSVARMCDTARAQAL
jgi:hypothetical protein